MEGHGSGKVALITGVTGQDGAYLTEFLLDKGYVVHGMQRRASSPNTSRVDGFLRAPHEGNPRFVLHVGDMTDTANVTRIVQRTQPGEIYNLAAQSHVKVSFDTAEYTADVDALGTLRLLEAIRMLGLERRTRFYQASTSELYGLVQATPQNERTPFYPRSPYAVAKLYAYWIVVNYREAYGIHASNGILFNHESPLRDEKFVTRKITQAAAAIKLGLQSKLLLGNLDVRRDWGHARDYVRGMWLILQHDRPDDFVLATGKTTSVREFVNAAFEEVGISLEWTGSGIEEKGIDSKTGTVLVEVDPLYFRPTEVDLLVGDASKAARILGWAPELDWRALCTEMVRHDLRTLGAEQRAASASLERSSAE